MTFMYPRTVTIRRPVPHTGTGALGYGGLNAANETVIASGLPASIQQQRAQGAPEAHLPADPARGSTAWRILVRSKDRDLIQGRDIIVDDLGVRYQVVAPYWNSLGYNLFCNRLET